MREVFEGHVIVYYENRDWRIEYKINKDEECVFQDEDKWTEVKQTWIDAMLDSKVVETIMGVFKSTDKPESDPENKLSEDNTMTLNMTQEQFDKAVADAVTTSIDTALKTEFAALREAMTVTANPETPEGDEEDPQPFDILKEFDLEDQKGLASTEMAKHLTDQFEAIRAQVKNESALQIKKIRRETYLSEFASKVTAGNADTPYGIPIKSDELKDWLMSLTPDQAEFAKNMLDGFWKSGRVEFSELGHGKDAGGTKKLDEATANSLRDGSLTTADLNNPILGLGDLAQYDLSEFKE